MLATQTPALFHVGVKGIVRNKDKKILVLERELPNGKQYWEIPGGRLLRGESVIDTLTRELREEVGITSISSAVHFCTLLTDIQVHDENDVGLIFMIFQIQLPKDIQPMISVEHKGFKWATVDETIERLTQYPTEFKQQLKLSHFTL